MSCRRRWRELQPWRPDKARQARIVSEDATAAQAFREVDRLASRMARSGAPSDAVELLVVDSLRAVAEAIDLAKDDLPAKTLLAVIVNDD